MAPLSLLLAGGLAFAAAAAQIAGPLPDPPVGGWRFTAAAGGCDAEIGFPGGAQLRVSHHPGRDESSFAVWDPAWRSIRGGRQYRATLRFSPTSVFAAANALGARLAGAERRSGLIVVTAGTALIERFAAGGGTVDILVGRDRLGVYAVPDPGAAMAGLRRCAEEARNAGGKAPANLSSYFSADDYPRIAIRNLQQGTVGFRIAIGPDGRVSDCAITSSSGYVALDEATCRIVRQRVRYRPALDARGAPTTAVDDGSVTWVLPRR